MIDADKEHLIDFAEAARNLPRSASGTAVHAKTVARWALVGVKGIKLESLCMGARRVTSREACQRFFTALTTATNESLKPRGVAAPVTSVADREKLAAKGLL